MYNEIKTSFVAKIENVMLARTIGVGFLVNLDSEIKVFTSLTKFNFVSKKALVVNQGFLLFLFALHF